MRHDAQHHAIFNNELQKLSTKNVRRACVGSNDDTKLMKYTMRHTRLSLYFYLRQLEEYSV